MPLIYNEDLSGRAQENRVYGEQHTLTKYNADPYNYVLPKYAPYYVGSMVVRHVTASGTRLLTPDVDYELCNLCSNISRGTGVIFYGGISFLDRDLVGTVEIDYNTIGGKWVGDRNTILQTIINEVYIPRVVHWDQITNVPDVFPPNVHQTQLDRIYGQQALIKGLDDVVAAIASDERNITAQELAVALASINNSILKLRTEVDRHKVPVGTVIAWPLPNPPGDYITANGAALDRAVFPELFAVLGTFYTSSPDTTKFNIPDYRDSFLRGYGPINSNNFNEKQHGTLISGVNLWHQGQADHIVRYSRLVDTTTTQNTADTIHADHLTPAQFAGPYAGPKMFEEIPVGDKVIPGTTPGNHTSTGAFGVMRPNNNAVTFCIKYQ